MESEPVAVTAAGLFGFPSHAVITGPCSLHVDGDHQVSKGKDREEEEEEPEAGRHGFNVLV